jgi:hypothetical protein
MYLTLVQGLVPRCSKLSKLFAEPRVGGFGCVLGLQDPVIRQLSLQPPTRRSGSSGGFRSFQSTESWRLRSRGSGRTASMPSGLCCLAGADCIEGR